MGLMSRVEDRPTPSAVYNWRVWTLAAIASFASCMIGYDSAFIGGTLALPSFQKSFNHGKALSASVSANLVTTYQAGAFFGAFARCRQFGGIVPSFSSFLLLGALASGLVPLRTLCLSSWALRRRGIVPL